MPSLLTTFLSSLAITAAADFDAMVGRADSRIRFVSEDDKLVLDVKSGVGIDTATIKRATKKWPKKVLVRLHLHGLESFRVDAGDVAVEWSVSSSGDHSSRVSLRQDSTEMPLAKDSPYFTDVRIVGGDRKLPLKDGYFEVPLPAKLLQNNPRTITLRWVDFYRN